MNKRSYKKSNKTSKRTKKNRSRKNKKGGSVSHNIANKISKISSPKCVDRDENSCYLVTNCKWDKKNSECLDIDDIGNINCNNLTWYSCLEPCKWNGNMLNGYCNNAQFQTNKSHLSEKEAILNERDTLMIELQRIKKEDDSYTKKKITPAIMKSRLKLRDDHRKLEIQIEELNHELEKLKDVSDLRKLKETQSK